MPAVFTALQKGQAITRWLYGAATEQPFAGKARPQPDNVTYEFGLAAPDTGQSPAREALEQRAPQPARKPGGPFDQLYLAGASPNIDFSHFAFTPTLITRGLICKLRCEDGGPVQFRVSTCGRIRLWRGAQMVAEFAPYTQNREQTQEVTIDLPPGESDLTVELQDLFERNTVNLFSITYLGGAALSAGIDAPDADALLQMAKVLDSLESAEVFWQTGPLRLRADCPPEQDLEIEIIRLAQFRRADAFEALGIDPFAVTLEAGAREVALPVGGPLPSGATEIIARARLGDLTMEKRIGTTILTRAVQITGADLNARKRQALALAAEDTGFEITVALARLALGHAVDARMRAQLDEALTGIEARRDCSDFTLLPVLRIWRDHRDALPTDIMQRMRAAILGYRYWLSEPGNDAMWFWSENHVLCFHIAQLIAGGLFPQDVFANSGKTGQQHEAEATARLHRWFDATDRDGLCEWNSAAYYPIDFHALFSLHGMTDDSALRIRAAKLLDRIFVMTGLHCTGGTPAGTAGRGYEKELLSGRANELAATWAVAFGGTWMPAYGRAAFGLCLCDYEPPPKAAELAQPAPGDVIKTGYWQGVGALGKLNLWKSDQAQMSTVADHFTGEVGQQQHVIDIQCAAHQMARLWVNHPGDRKPWSERRPSKLAGNHILPRVAQDGAQAFVIYDIPDDPRFVPFTQLFGIEAAFDSVLQAGAHWLLRSGAVTVAVWCSAPLLREAEGPYRHAVWRAQALRSAWHVHVHATPDDAEASHLAQRLQKSANHFDRDALRLSVEDYLLDYRAGLTKAGQPVVQSGPGHLPQIRG